MGCIGANASDEKIKLASEYAYKLGLAFQIVDDILDVTSDASVLGKDCGNDAAHNKTTFMTYFTPDSARHYAEELTDRAVASIHKYHGSERLCGLAYYLLDRSF